MRDISNLGYYQHGKCLRYPRIKFKVLHAQQHIKNDFNMVQLLQNKMFNQPVLKISKNRVLHTQKYNQIATHSTNQPFDLLI